MSDFENRCIPQFSKYGAYLSVVPKRLQKEWMNYYGFDFCIEHIGSCRIHEMAGQEPVKNRGAYLSAWLLNAKKEEKNFRISGGALQIIAEELKKRSEEERVILENIGV